MDTPPTAPTEVIRMSTVVAAAETGMGADDGPTGIRGSLPEPPLNGGEERPEPMEEKGARTRSTVRRGKRRGPTSVRAVAIVGGWPPGGDGGGCDDRPVVAVHGPADDGGKNRRVGRWTPATTMGGPRFTPQKGTQWVGVRPPWRY